MLVGVILVTLAAKTCDGWNVESNSIDDDLIHIIYPGTKWCGSGNVAVDYNDLGSHPTTDACCREHDMCPDLIKAGQSAHGLTNYALYTRLHCDCDIAFLDCLRSTSRDDKASQVVGVIYFDVLNTKCYRLDYPVVGCSNYNKVTGRCLEYEYNTTAGSKEWQWFEVPQF